MTDPHLTPVSAIAVLRFVEQILADLEHGRPGDARSKLMRSLAEPMPVLARDSLAAAYGALVALEPDLKYAEAALRDLRETCEGKAH